MPFQIPVRSRGSAAIGPSRLPVVESHEAHCPFSRRPRPHSFSALVHEALLAAVIALCYNITFMQKLSAVPETGCSGYEPDTSWEVPRAAGQSRSASFSCDPSVAVFHKRVVRVRHEHARQMGSGLEGRVMQAWRDGRRCKDWFRLFSATDSQLDDATLPQYVGRPGSSPGATPGGM